MSYRSEHIFNECSSSGSNNIFDDLNIITRNTIHRGGSIVICDGLKVTYGYVCRYVRHEYNPCRRESSAQRWIRSPSFSIVKEHPKRIVSSRSIGSLAKSQMMHKNWRSILLFQSNDMKFSNVYILYRYYILF